MQNIIKFSLFILGRSASDPAAKLLLEQIMLDTKVKNKHKNN